MAEIPTLYVLARKGSRDELRTATGADKPQALKLPHGTVITHSRAILSLVAQQGRSAGARADTA